MIEKHSNSIGFLFDLDGVLIDSETKYTRFWNEINRLYPTGDPDYALTIKGTTLPEILKDFPDADVQADVLKRIKEFQDVMTYDIFDGVIPFLESLKSEGIPSAIVTSSDRRKMDHMFESLPGFRDYFTTVIDASLVTRSKPDPQGYLLGADAIGIAPDNCFVCEDSIQGLKAGRAAGATVVGLATTYPADRIAGLADMVISGFKDVTLDEFLAIRVSKLNKL